MKHSRDIPTYSGIMFVFYLCLPQMVLGKLNILGEKSSPPPLDRTLTADRSTLLESTSICTWQALGGGGGGNFPRHTRSILYNQAEKWHGFFLITAISDTFTKPCVGMFMAPMGGGEMHGHHTHEFISSIYLT